jgi:hypothetical protein
MFARERLRIVVGGFLGLTPGGGVAWDYVQWPLGFAQLGHDVIYVEDTRLWPIYQEGAAVDCDPNVSRVRSVMAAFGLESRWAYRDEVSGECFGLSLEQLQEFCRSADLFVNISCSTFLRDEYLTIPVRALVDTDPMFTQIQYCNEVSFTSEKSGIREMFAGHTHYFTFGENIGQPDCRVPDCGVKWHSTRQPICLSHWDATPIPKQSASAFTTLMNWTAARDLVFEGDTWGQKNVSLMRFLDLPQVIDGINLAVAVSQTSGTPFPADLFRDHGWTVLSPEQCAPDWRSYRSFLSKSFGEFSVAIKRGQDGSLVVLHATWLRAVQSWHRRPAGQLTFPLDAVFSRSTTWKARVPPSARLPTVRKSMRKLQGNSPKSTSRLRRYCPRYSVI